MRQDIYAAKKAEEEREKEYGLTEGQKEAISAAKELKEAYDDSTRARNESMAAISAEYGYLGGLKEELEGLIDTNGQVKSGYEDRANFIINELSRSLGIEEQDIRDIIAANGDLSDSIDKIIEKKQAEATLAANEDAYKEAIQKRNEALKTYQENVESLELAEEKYQETQNNSNEVLKTYHEMWGRSPADATNYLIANQSVIEGNEKAKESYEKAKKGLEDAEDAYVGYNTVIKNYEGLSSAIINGETEKIQNALYDMQNDFITAETGTRRSLENQVKNMQETYIDLKKAIEDGTPGVTQAQVDAAKKMVDKAKAELDKLPQEAKEIGSLAGAQYAYGIESQKGNASKQGAAVAESAKTGMGSKSADNEGRNLTASLVRGIDSLDTLKIGYDKASEAKGGMGSVSAYDEGYNFTEGFGNGMNRVDLWGVAYDIGKSALSGIKKALKIESPSKETFEVGEYFTAGFSNALAEGTKSVAKKAAGMGRNALNAVKREVAEGIEIPDTRAEGTGAYVYTQPAGISWYKSGAIMSSKMIFGAAGGTLLAGGEPETGGGERQSCRSHRFTRD